MSSNDWEACFEQIIIKLATARNVEDIRLVLIDSYCLLAPLAEKCIQKNNGAGAEALRLRLHRVVSVSSSARKEVKSHNEKDSFTVLSYDVLLTRLISLTISMTLLANDLEERVKLRTISCYLFVTLGNNVDHMLDTILNAVGFSSENGPFYVPLYRKLVKTASLTLTAKNFLKLVILCNRFFEWISTTDVFDVKQAVLKISPRDVPIDEVIMIISTQYRLFTLAKSGWFSFVNELMTKLTPSNQNCLLKAWDADIIKALSEISSYFTYGSAEHQLVSSIGDSKKKKRQKKLKSINANLDSLNFAKTVDASFEEQPLKDKNVLLDDCHRSNVIHEDNARVCHIEQEKLVRSIGTLTTEDFICLSDVKSGNQDPKMKKRKEKQRFQVGKSSKDVEISNLANVKKSKLINVQKSKSFKIPKRLLDHDNSAILPLASNSEVEDTIDETGSTSSTIDVNCTEIELKLMKLVKDSDGNDQSLLTNFQEKEQLLKNESSRLKQEKQTLTAENLKLKEMRQLYNLSKTTENADGNSMSMNTVINSNFEVLNGECESQGATSIAIEDDTKKEDTICNEMSSSELRAKQSVLVSKEIEERFIPVAKENSGTTLIETEDDTEGEDIVCDRIGSLGLRAQKDVLVSKEIEIEERCIPVEKEDSEVENKLNTLRHKIIGRICDGMSSSELRAKQNVLVSKEIEERFIPVAKENSGTTLIETEDDTIGEDIVCDRIGSLGLRAPKYVLVSKEIEIEERCIPVEKEDSEADVSKETCLTAHCDRIRRPKLCAQNELSKTEFEEGPRKIEFEEGPTSIEVHASEISENVGMKSKTERGTKDLKSADAECTVFKSDNVDCSGLHCNEVIPSNDDLNIDGSENRKEKHILIESVIDKMKYYEFSENNVKIMGETKDESFNENSDDSLSSDDSMKLCLVLDISDNSDVENKIHNPIDEISCPPEDISQVEERIETLENASIENSVVVLTTMPLTEIIQKGDNKNEDKPFENSSIGELIEEPVVTLTSISLVNTNRSDKIQEDDNSNEDDKSENYPIDHTIEEPGAVLSIPTGCTDTSDIIQEDDNMNDSRLKHDCETQLVLGIELDKGHQILPLEEASVEMASSQITGPKLDDTLESRVNNILIQSSSDSNEPKFSEKGDSKHETLSSQMVFIKMDNIWNKSVKEYIEQLIPTDKKVNAANQCVDVLDEDAKKEAISDGNIQHEYSGDIDVFKIKIENTSQPGTPSTVVTRATKRLRIENSQRIALSPSPSSTFSQTPPKIKLEIESSSALSPAPTQSLNDDVETQLIRSPQSVISNQRRRSRSVSRLSPMLDTRDTTISALNTKRRRMNDNSDNDQIEDFIEVGEGVAAINRPLQQSPTAHQSSRRRQFSEPMHTLSSPSAAIARISESSERRRTRSTVGKELLQISEYEMSKNVSAADKISRQSSISKIAHSSNPDVDSDEISESGTRKRTRSTFGKELFQISKNQISEDVSAIDKIRRRSSTSRITHSSNLDGDIDVISGSSTRRRMRSIADQLLPNIFENESDDDAITIDKMNRPISVRLKRILPSQILETPAQKIQRQELGLSGTARSSLRLRSRVAPISKGDDILKGSGASSSLAEIMATSANNPSTDDRFNQSNSLLKIDNFKRNSVSSVTASPARRSSRLSGNPVTSVSSSSLCSNRTTETSDMDIDSTETPGKRGYGLRNRSSKIADDFCR